MKPLLRWTIGPATDSGLETLEKSVRSIKKIYADRFDLMICYNQINIEKIKYLEQFGVCFYNQNHYKKLEYSPKGEIWKIYPPRLRLESHEITIDNDLIIFKKIPEIEDFLVSNATLLLEARKGACRSYGKYDHLVPRGYIINTGLFGCPPNFDFYEKINTICRKDNIKYWIQNRYTNEYDDQGIITAALLDYEQCIIIRHPVIFNYNLAFGSFDGDVPKICGIHFVGINIGYHKNWKKFYFEKFHPYVL